MTLAEAKDLATIVGTIAAICGAAVAIYKTLEEVKKGREQREADHKLRRAEFTLAQHRRLFDDPELYSVLRLIDDDDTKLAKHEMWDSKRKFLTFIEELCLLVNAKYIEEDVAIYMFGYYAVSAFEGKNFREGIAWEEKYWRLFFDFAKKAKQKLTSLEQSTDSVGRLSF